MVTTESNGHEPPADSVRGRFLLIPAPGGGVMLHWVTDLCDRCLDCGCGTQRKAFDLTPAGAMNTFMRLRKLQKDGILSERG